MTLPPRARCALSLILFAGAVQGQYRFDHWTTSEGLPQNSVVDIVQTHDSYLWFTTSDGLVRFDGIKFTVFNRENSPGMTSTRLTSLYEDRNHDLWMGTLRTTEHRRVSEQPARWFSGD